MLNNAAVNSYNGTDRPIKAHHGTLSIWQLDILHFIQTEFVFLKFQIFYSGIWIVQWFT